MAVTDPASHEAADEAVRHAKRAAAVMGVLLGFALVGLVVLALWDRSTQLPDNYDIAERFLVAQNVGDQWLTPMDDDEVPTFELDDMQVPIALPACSAIDQVGVQAQRTWLASTADGAVSAAIADQLAASETISFPSTLSAGECGLVGRPVPIPAEVAERALNDPSLVWRISATARSVDPLGELHRSVSEPFRLVDTASRVTFRDRTPALQELLLALQDRTSIVLAVGLVP